MSKVELNLKVALGDDKRKFYGYPMALGAGRGREAVDRVLPRPGLHWVHYPYLATM